MHDLLFIMYAFAALLLLLLASPPHFKSGNIGACVLVVWAFIGALGYLVNAINWWDNIDDPSPIWCDIWVKLHVGITTGIASGCLCINRRLMVISSAKRSNVSSRDKKIQFWGDLAIGIVPAVVIMAVSYTRQANRYAILEGFGCYPVIYYDVGALLAIHTPGLLIGLISFVYGGMAIYNFTSRRLQFQTVLKQSGGGLNTSRFVRLVALSFIEMLLSVPLSAYALANAAKEAPAEVLGWGEVHEDWYRIDKFNAMAVRGLGSAVSVSAAGRWLPVFAAFVYFAFFGMQDEALTAYKERALWVVALPGRAIRKARGRNEPSDGVDSLPCRAHLPNLGSAVAPVSPSGPVFPGRSQEDLEHGGLSLKMTNDGEKNDSLGYKPSGIAVRVERSVV